MWSEENPPTPVIAYNERAPTVNVSVPTSPPPPPPPAAAKNIADPKKAQAVDDRPLRNWGALICLVCGSFFCVAGVALAIALGITSMNWKSTPVEQPPKRCQVLGVDIGTVMRGINNDGSNCVENMCYNMTEYDVKLYIGTPRFVPANPAYFSCIDGRQNDENIATPAGDFGVFMSAMEIYIRNSDTPQNYKLERIQDTLRSFILNFRTPTNRFYMHTDTDAVERALDTLRTAGLRIDEGLQTFYMNNYVPQSAAWDILLNSLSNLDIGVGCGHIKLMGQNPTDYGIQNADLVTNSLRALWTLKWGDLNDRIFVEALSHNHDEQAVLTITEVKGCDSMVPVVDQRAGQYNSNKYALKMIMNYDYSVKAFRDQVAAWFVQRPGASAALSAAAFRQQLDALADGVQFLASAGRMARGRTMFSASVTGRPFTLPTP